MPEQGLERLVSCPSFLARRSRRRAIRLACAIRAVVPATSDETRVPTRTRGRRKAVCGLRRRLSECRRHARTLSALLTPHLSAYHNKDQTLWGSVVRSPLVAAVCVALSGCATVHQEDFDAWKGAPVAALETHPIFMTMPVVRTVASDGTEIRRYVNGGNVSSCSGGGRFLRARLIWRPTTVSQAACRPLRLVTISFTSKTATFSSTQQ